MNRSGRGSTFFIELSLIDDVELDIIPYDDHHATLDHDWCGTDDADVVVTPTDTVATLKDASEDSSVSEINRHRQPAVMLSKEKSVLNYRFLLVEDVSMNREFIKLWLKNLFVDCFVVEAENGKEGLRQYQDAVENSMPFDVVLMDIGMPIMDGFECLNEMHRRWGNNRPPIVAMTTSPREIETQQPASAAAKFDDWWDKTDQKNMAQGLLKLLIDTHTHI